MPRKNPPKSAADYIARLPETTQAQFLRLREIVRSAAPRDAIEIISYGIPALKQKKVLVWYAAFSSHVSLFPTGAVIQQFQDELKDYRTSKGTIQFPVDKRLPAPLIRKIVKARVALASKSPG